MRAWYLATSSLLELAAAALSGLVLYEGIIVPLLPIVRNVPLWWWLLGASPIWVAALGLGWFAASARELAAISLAGALGCQTYIYWASITLRPGLANQPRAETVPLLFWTAGTALLAIVLFVPCAAGFVGMRLLADRRGNQAASSS